MNGENYGLLRVANGKESCAHCESLTLLNSIPPKLYKRFLCLLLSFFIVRPVLAEPKPWYICTSKPYQLTFGSSMQCPNIEQKVKRELDNYITWTYQREIPRPKSVRENKLYRRKLAAARNNALIELRTFECRWVEGL